MDNHTRKEFCIDSFFPSFCPLSFIDLIPHNTHSNVRGAEQVGYRILRDFLRQSHRDDDEGSREKGGNVLEHSIVARDWGFLATASAFVPHPGFHSGFDSIFSFFVGGWWTEEKVIQSAGSATYVVGKRKKNPLTAFFAAHSARNIRGRRRRRKF